MVCGILLLFLNILDETAFVKQHTDTFENNAIFFLKT